MGVKVASGGIKIPSGSSYPYVAWQDAAANLSITSADPTNPRRDLVLAYIDLTEVDDSQPNNPDAFKLAVVAGTPSSSPSDPNETAIDTVIGASNPYSVLARVRVSAAPLSSITNSFIDDLRTIACLANQVLYRVGGTTGDDSWRTTGTSSTDISRKRVYEQVGSVATVTGNDTTVTFPKEYAQIPNVVATVVGGNSGTGPPTQNAFPVIVSVTTAQFVIRTINDGGGQSNQGVNWVAKGQI